MRGNTSRPCGTLPMPRRERACAALPAISAPLKRTEPEVGGDLAVGRGKIDALQDRLAAVAPDQTKAQRRERPIAEIHGVADGVGIHDQRGQPEQRAASERLRALKPRNHSSDAISSRNASQIRSRSMKPETPRGRTRINDDSDQQADLARQLPQPGRHRGANQG